MKHLKSLFITLALIALIASGCKDQESIVGFDNEPMTDMEAIQKLAAEDETLQSFDLNYNEDGTPKSILGKVSSEVYPVHFGQKMVLINRDLNIVIDGDSASGVLTKTYEGTLFISASLDEFNWGDLNIVDTIIEKSFISVVTQNVKFEKSPGVRSGNGGNNGYGDGDGDGDCENLNECDDEYNGWRIVSTSLPVGGTNGDNIYITNLTFYLPNDDTLSINDPSSYFVDREKGPKGIKQHRQMPSLAKFEEVKLSIEIKSKFEDPDYLSISYGASVSAPLASEKRLLDLVSSEFDGQYYTKVYEETFRTKNVSGNNHAVITAIPKQVVHDSEAEVEEISWGLPYKVR